jgi:hypothetical protein
MQSVPITTKVVSLKLITKVITVKPVLGGHLWNKEKVAL